MNTEDNKIIESTDIETQNTVHQQENPNITEITDTNISEVTSVIETPQVVESKPKNNKILSIILLFIFLILIVVSIIVIPKLIPDKNNQLDTNIQEPSKNEITEEQKDNKDEIVEETSPIEEQQKPEEQPKEEEKPSTETNNNQNNTTNKEENKNNSSSSSSNNSSSSSGTNNSESDNNSSSTPETPVTPEETKPEPTIVTTNTISLDNYSTDIKITKGGEYTLSGTLNYTLYIEADSAVTLNLNGVTIKSKTDAAIANLNTKSLIINLKSGTNNTLSDAIIESEYDGCIFSYGDITVDGSGYLTVYGNQIDGEGIATKNSPILINDGNISIYTVDDGLNTGGTGGTIAINGGNVFVQAGGDGVDSNQDITINGGTLSVIGGASTANSGLDADEGISINGGTTLALGSEQLQMPDEANQYTIGFSLNSSITTNTLVTLVDENDNVIISFKAPDKFKNIIISSNKLVPGKYYLYKGGSNTGTLKNGIYSGGTYTKGELISIDSISEFVIENKITTYAAK